MHYNMRSVKCEVRDVMRNVGASIARPYFEAKPKKSDKIWRLSKIISLWTHYEK